MKNGAITSGRSSGMWKVAFETAGRYKITLCRFPRESELAINATFPEAAENIEIQGRRPASVKNDFTKAYLCIADINKTLKIAANDKEVSFMANIPEGKYDMIAELEDNEGRAYPAYYVYIEKLD